MPKNTWPRRSAFGSTGEAMSGYIDRNDPRFPADLAALSGSPDGLYVEGVLSDLPGVAVVGSRRASRYGLGIARTFGATVAGAGWTVVSGLARGVDGAAHRGTLEACGRGIGVLAGGLDRFYPAEHRELATGLVSGGGAIVSEHPAGTPPEPWRFPQRNRIISGLSKVVIVVEAAPDSGALITARLALEQDREVFAVPGDIDRQTATGCNLLIRDGAWPVLGTADLIEALSVVMGPPPKQRATAGATGGPLLDLVGPAGREVEELADLAGLPVPALLAALGRLEAEGAVLIEEGVVRLA